MFRFDKKISYLEMAEGQARRRHSNRSRAECTEDKVLKPDVRLKRTTIRGVEFHKASSYQKRFFISGNYELSTK